MSKKTLLELVQSILSDIDGDQVNSITETVESLQVANIIKNTYYNIIDGKDWPQLFNMFKLTASGTTARPTHMTIPETINEISWVKYNKRKSTDTIDKFSTIEYKTPLEFMNMLNARSQDLSYVVQITDPSGITLNIYNDRSPSYYTTFDSSVLVFDSYDSTVDSTLQTDKTQIFAKYTPTWTESDTFIPNLPVQAFSYLENEALSITSLRMRQTPDQKAEQHSISQRRRMSQEKWKILKQKGIRVDNYGRK